MRIGGCQNRNVQHPRSNCFCLFLTGRPNLAAIWQWRCRPVLWVSTIPASRRIRTCFEVLYSDTLRRMDNSPTVDGRFSNSRTIRHRVSSARAFRYDWQPVETFRDTVSRVSPFSRQLNISCEHASAGFTHFPWLDQNTRPSRLNPASVSPGKRAFLQPDRKIVPACRTFKIYDNVLSRRSFNAIRLSGNFGW